MVDYIDLFRDSKTGVVKIEFIKARESIGGGSGFLANDMLVTNNHVFLGCYPDLENIQVQLTRHCGDKYDKILLSGAEFSQANINSSEESKNDYTVLDIKRFPKNISQFFKGYQFSLESSEMVCEGLPIAFIGYPFRKNNVTCHTGYVSSIFDSNNVNVIQIDGSVNGGNSGGPLLNACTGKVVGIVTRTEKGYIVDSFNALIKNLEQNLAIINNGKANIQLGNISLRDGFRATHISMLEISKNLMKSANVGIGYAFSIDPVMDALGVTQSISS